MMTRPNLLILITMARAVAAADAPPPGPGPFGSVVLAQPVPGAARCVEEDRWKKGKQCAVSDYGDVASVTVAEATKAVQAAIDDCGDRAEGGTVLIPKNVQVTTGSLFLKSNLTLRIEKNATLKGSADRGDYARVYTRREAVMLEAYAGLVNGAKCVRKKAPLVGWDDCAEWGRLENVCLEGGGTIDGDGGQWFGLVPSRERSMLLDLLFVRGLTIRDLHIRRSGYWTVHPTFSDNVRVTGLKIDTVEAEDYAAHNTDGVDPDSCWNVYVADNTFETGDDCVALKSGRDWSGRMVNVSTRNVLLERNAFKRGHGVERRPSVFVSFSSHPRVFRRLDRKRDGRLDL